jgi:hypothetical protein
VRAAGVLAAVLFGVYLSIRGLAALYAVLDLWYAVRRTWPRMVRGLVTWGGITAVAVWRLAPPYRTGFLFGLAGYVLFYLALFPLRDIGLRALARRPARTLLGAVLLLGSPGARAVQ